MKHVLLSVFVAWFFVSGLSVDEKKTTIFANVFFVDVVSPENEINNLKPTPTTNSTVPTTNSTTTMKSTQGPQPTPPTNLTAGNYSLMKDKVICLRANMALQIRMVTPKANGTFIVQPKYTSATGFCETTTANLTLGFKEGYITFMFTKTTAENLAFVNALSFNVSYNIRKGDSRQLTGNNKTLHLFAAKVGHAYSCKEESLYMGSGLYLDISQDRMQAFNLTKSQEFGISEVCSADQPHYGVAIGVGVALLVLIVVVFIVYLVARQRRTGGYQML